MIEDPYNLHRRLSGALQIVIGFGLIASLSQERWLISFLVGWILVLALLPLILRRRMQVLIPPEFELVAFVVSGFGFVYMRTGRQSFIEDSILRFVRANPHLFPKE